jgi:hypothetical protein
MKKTWIDIELEKIACFDQIKSLLETMDKDDQRFIVWSHLCYLVAMNPHNLTWIMDKLEDLLNNTENQLLSPFQ